MITKEQENRLRELVSEINEILYENPKKGSGICVICGKQINPKYYQCYECYMRHSTNK